MRKYLVYSVILILVSFLMGIFLYSQLPDMLASHWNSQGEVNGYMSKFWGLFLLPVLCVAMFLLFVFLPRIDPLRKDMEGFRNYYDFFIALIFSFMFYLYLLTLLWNMGFRFNMGVFLVPAFALLFFYIGIILEKSKRNWFLGIRNPWTMSSDFVWEKTHKFGSLLFKASSIIMLAGIFLQRLALFLVIIPIIITIIATMFYSYKIFKEREYSKPSPKKAEKVEKNKIVKKKTEKKK